MHGFLLTVIILISELVSCRDQCVWRERAGITARTGRMER